MKILLTAFEPFNNLPTNSSLEVQKNISSEDIIKLELPVSYERSKLILSDAISKYKPDFVLCLGQAQGEDRIRLEYVGLNYTRASIPDNDGVFKNKGLVYNDSKEAYFTKLEVEDIVDELSKIMPTYLSLSAGGYICNTIYYTALKHMDGNALFVHLPLFDGQLANSKSMPLNQMIEAVNFIINKIKNN